MNLYIDITRTLILVYVLSILSCAYVTTLNDILKKRLTSDNLSGCLFLSLIPIVNTALSIYNGIDNLVMLCKYYK